MEAHEVATSAKESTRKNRAIMMLAHVPFPLGYEPDFNGLV